jgi:hypothetical protein
MTMSSSSINPFPPFRIPAAIAITPEAEAAFMRYLAFKREALEALMRLPDALEERRRQDAADQEQLLLIRRMMDLSLETQEAITQSLEEAQGSATREFLEPYQELMARRDALRGSAQERVLEEIEQIKETLDIACAQTEEICESSLLNEIWAQFTANLLNDPLTRPWAERLQLPESFETPSPYLVASWICDAKLGSCTAEQTRLQSEQDDQFLRTLLFRSN